MKLRLAEAQDTWNNRILVVEDEREIGRLYQEMLGGTAQANSAIRSSRSTSKVVQPTVAAGEFVLTVVTNAEEAIAQVKLSLKNGRPFAMGFFDVLLGAGMDGIELVRQLHELDPSLNAVFVTAYQDRSVDAIRNVLENSRDVSWDYVNKPFSQGEILQKARNFTSLWNLTRDKETREAQLAEAHRRLLSQERTAAVAAVARGVSHEFGNILMQIMGKADLGRRKPEKEMRESLEKILDATTRAAEILSRFKHLSNPNAPTAKRSKVNLGQLIDNAIDLLEPTLRNHNIKICKIKMDPVQVVAQETSLLQVIVNLVINASHAMGESGQIDFSVTQIGDEVELKVRDYGPGIPVELLDKVLEPSFTTKGDKGSGLGLAIVREIVEIEHRGELKLQNHGVKGLEVSIRLPLKVAEEGGDRVAS